jgi:hypothetical protein
LVSALRTVQGTSHETLSAALPEMKMMIMMMTMMMMKMNVAGGTCASVVVNKR